MPTTRSRGLSTADLDTLRTAVEAGRKPKVQFTSAAGQVAGQIGQVVRFDDPSADEWVVVRFGRDELPFAPGDLQLPPPKPPRPKTAPAPRQAAGASSPAPVAVDAAPSAKTPEPAAAVAAATATPSRTVTAPAGTPSTAAEAAAAAKPGGATKQPTPAPAKPAATPATPANASASAAPKSRPARKAAAKRAPDLTVTLGHHDGQWTVSAARGARVLIKPTPVRAADALRMVGQLDSPAVAEAVEEIVAAARAEAEEQAERLRRELAEVEAALADLSDDE
ncbi:hypothetical protein [Cryptosporangium aurantiacum]|uniref:Uncharacterized protein n=1 Tax=Cryptosporangium aurantiacum TaxID=134849 RepID=A0A1M7RCW7_9ACTN|nr:hypothetical protein [Cryptosporangium aurantiacum]SHN43989.1 hypothetical protein SAMN05443668_1104 [Cryptosporangium aurantiacum]